MIRDNSLDGRDRNGRELTANEQLEEALEKGAPNDPNLDVIRKLLKKRDCFLFPKPVKKEDLRNIESIPLEEMKPEFQEAMR